MVRDSSTLILLLQWRQRRHKIRFSVQSFGNPSCKWGWLTRREARSLRTAHLRAVHSSLAHGLLFRRSSRSDRLCIPEVPALRQLTLTELHATPLGGHFGRDKTLSLAQRSVWWPSLAADVETFIRTRPTCQRVKAEHGRPAGLLFPLPVPSRRGGMIGLDFLEMPIAQSGHDFLQVHIDFLTGRVWLVPTFKSVTSSAAATNFMSSVFRDVGLPDTLVSDRDTRFTSEFWTALHAALGTSLIFGSPYHHNTNSRTERVNAVIADVLGASALHKGSSKMRLYLQTCFAALSTVAKRIGRRSFHSLNSPSTIPLRHLATDILHSTPIAASTHAGPSWLLGRSATTMVSPGGASPNTCPWSQARCGASCWRANWHARHDWIPIAATYNLSRATRFFWIPRTPLSLPATSSHLAGWAPSACSPRQLRAPTASTFPRAAVACLLGARRGTPASLPPPPACAGRR